MLQVLNECVEAEAWLREKKQQQDSLPKYATPVLSSVEVLKKTHTLDGYLSYFLYFNLIYLVGKEIEFYS
jgi:hypothetical protein